jgi:hypothetical protein
MLSGSKNCSGRSPDPPHRREEECGALNRLGLAVPSEATKQREQLRYHARLKARELLAWDEAKEVKVRGLLVGGRQFEEIARLAKGERAD